MASTAGSTSAPATATVTVVEPDLSIVKSVDDDSAAGGADAGDTVTYTIVVSHTEGVSNADAFGLVITDDIPAQIDIDTLEVLPAELVPGG